jgi:hypothetical protein
VRSRFKPALMCCVVIALVSAIWAPSALARQPEYQGGYEIINAATHRCLDAFSSYGGGNGNPVGLFDCNGGRTEEWHIWLNADARSYSIRNALNLRSLDYPGLANGHVGYQYGLWDYYPSVGQVFGLEFAPHLTWLIYNTAFSGVMDAFQVDGGGNGNRVGLWWYTGSPLQNWTLRCVNDPCTLKIIRDQEGG